ncbi:Aliphatic amidase expression-regulating protein [wastewater metagenome]|uniref:Aliphatic amidase expression-regulating protein n=2 Tax=unclassified sequences TaxID=12908 RepID=A0A5B8RAU5_9ZZZZ|nr:MULTISPECIES: transporter substrate-binding domain-containing protein [Arhodomonas]MCS4504980.1 transporter substrate-binding domain-containing protein [Arhodomonas aquaeolei]QEA05058.1 aliphatic amidase expression-regulating protein [uncultured organism]
MSRDIQSGKPWRLGVLFSQTGTTAVIERTQLRATLLAIEEVNEAGGVDGREIEPVVYDPGSVMERYGELAERLFTEDDVEVIIGCYTSSSRKEVLPVVERRNALFFYPTLYEGFEYSPNVIYGGAAPNQNSVPLARYLMENFGERFCFVGSDYIYPRESNRVMRNIVRQAGGEVVGEFYTELDAGADDFQPILAEIERLRPDVIFSTVVGDATVRFYQSYLAYPGDGTSVPIGSLTTSESEVAAMGAEAAAGHITAAPYFQNLETEANRAFLKRFRARYGDDTVVTSCGEASYFQVHMFANALRMAGSTDTDRLRDVLRGSEFEAPQGRVKIDPDNNHTYLHSRIARVDRTGQYVVERELPRAIKPDPYLVVPALNDWSVDITHPGRRRRS